MVFFYPPGGFRCLGVSEREASAGLCGHEYFYNQELQECQACSDCDGVPIASPCTTTSDAVCGPLSDSRLSQVWSAASGLPSPKARAGQQIIPGLQLSILGGEATDLLSSRDGQLTLRQHGLLWVDHNIAVKHGCRNYLQVGVRLNGSEEEVQELSSVRLEQPDRKRFQVRVHRRTCSRVVVEIFIVTIHTKIALNSLEELVFKCVIVKLKLAKKLKETETHQNKIEAVLLDDMRSIKDRVNK